MEGKGMMTMTTGYDGNGVAIGDRIELHPGCDLWMRGARYGTVLHVTRAGNRVRVKLDKWPRPVTVDSTRVRLA